MHVSTKKLSRHEHPKTIVLLQDAAAKRLLKNNTIIATTPCKRTANAATFAHTTSTMFTMAPMFGGRPGKFKMPRLDAYDAFKKTPNQMTGRLSF